jgi:ADP-dependent NAD(P)H-hydrate dehydratase / NAD(P)H-hydrate epimerase
LDAFNDVPPELLTASEMRAAEDAVIASGTPGITLMERAGAAVAAHISAQFNRCRSAAVVCGPGNNGGDGFVVARHLKQRGVNPTVFTITPVETLTGDAALAAARWSERCQQLTDGAPLGQFDVIIDALFGLGINRDVVGSAAVAVRAINAALTSGTPVVAVDNPSGIDSETGLARGVAVRATSTVTFHRLKPGHVLQPGRSHAGRIVCVDIGLSAPTAAQLTINTPGLWTAALPRPDASTHKYMRGHALILAGGLEGVGAGRLAARAALRSGAGLVTIGVPGEALIAHASRGPDALMVRAVDGPEGLGRVLADKRRNAVVIGPAYGLGPATRTAVATVLAANRGTVLDADALSSFAGQTPALAALIASRPRGAPPVVLTPHGGEFATLFGTSEKSKIVRAQDAATATGAIVVFKGADTVIATPDGRTAVNVNGTSWLATAGTGDVLAGLIGSALAQGMPGFEAACAAVFQHAAAASRIGPGLIADDLADEVQLSDIRRSWLRN